MRNQPPQTPTALTRLTMTRLADLFYPPTCVLCGAPGADGLDLCVGCRADLPGIDPCCPRCALPLPESHPTGLPCGKCQRHPPPFDRCRALLRYQGPVPMLVGGLKFRARTDLIRLLGGLFADALATTLTADSDPAPCWPDAIVPVPLHPRRLRQRGYNQSLELARPIARRLHLPIDTRCCERVLATTPQMELERAARQRNIRGAFIACAPLHGRRLALIDDVVTTGSTVAELTRALQHAGCARVEVWALARTA